MKNKYRIPMIVVLSIIALFLFLLMMNIIRGDFSFRRDNLMVEKSYSKEEISKISILSKSSNITFQSSNSDEIVVSLYGNQKSFYDIKLENQELIVEKDKIRLCIGFCFSREEIVVKVPSDFMTSIEIQNSSGNVTISDISVNNLNVKLFSGEMNIEDALAANLSSSSGNIHFGKINSGILKTSSGSISGTEIHNIEASVSSGNIDIDNILESAQINTSSGRVRVNHFNVELNSSIKAKSGNITIKSSNDVYFETKTTSGNAKLNHNNRKSDITLYLEVTSGNIKVE